VVDGVGRPGLVQEPGQQLRIAGEIGVQHLDRHPPPDVRVLGQVNGPHAAFTQQRDRPVIPEPRPDHEAGIISS
jgi:hypothetical protein